MDLGLSIAARCRASFRLERRKHVLGRFVLRDRREIGFWSPGATRRPEGDYRIDVTLSQKSILGAFRQSIVAFRLQGEPVSFFLFEQLNSRLTESCMLFNTHEGDHWKLRISSGNGSLTIRIQGGGEVTIPAEADPCRLVEQAARH